MSLKFLQHCSLQLTAPIAVSNPDSSQEQQEPILRIKQFPAWHARAQARVEIGLSHNRRT